MFGAGRGRRALIVLVGEQPGDQEDLKGRRFVGPAGEGARECRAVAGIGRPRDLLYVTNAVKHFKFTPRGKRRLHQNPDAGEVQACQWWLGLERRFVQPRLIVGMGATAALALTGPSRRSLTERRGKVEETASGPVLLTWHPSFILRVPDEGRKAEARTQLAEDLTTARELLTA